MDAVESATSLAGASDTSGSVAAAPVQFTRLSKAEKKARRAETAGERRRAWRERQKEAHHVAVAARAAARAERLAAMDDAEPAPGALITIGRPMSVAASQRLFF